MVLGLSTNTFTVLHVALSLIAIIYGFAVIFALRGGNLYSVRTLVFLITTALTSITGFCFPNSTITLGIKLGILSVIALVIAIPALYLFKLVGVWRNTFVIASAFALYLNVFVLVAQLFKHVPLLHALDPTGSGPPFGISQLLLLVFFIWLTIGAVKKAR